MKGQRAKDKLRELDVRPSKERGQNFITDPNVLHSIIQFGRPQQAKILVEIGPGLGALTKELLPHPNFSVVEIEERFCQELSRNFPGIKVFNSDVRQFDFSQLGQEIVVFGNLPYSFSTEIIFHLLDQRDRLSRAVLMLQREFAERLAANPGGRDYGVLSVHAQMFADISLGPIIDGTAFHPIANVQSRLLELTFLKEARVPVSELAWFKRVVKASFLQRRRKLLNSLKSSGIAEPERIDAALKAASIDGGRRAETLSIVEFAKLAECLKMQG